MQDIDFNEWEIIIVVPDSDTNKIKGTLGETWPNLMLPDAVKEGAEIVVKNNSGEIICRSRR